MRRPVSREQRLPPLPPLRPLAPVQEAHGAKQHAAAEDEEALRRDRAEINLAYEHYLLISDGGAVTIPKLAYGIGIVCSVAGPLLVASMHDWQVMLGGLALLLGGVGLTELSYRLKRRAIEKNPARPTKTPPPPSAGHQPD